jgi:hypothetical protein
MVHLKTKTASRKAKLADAVYRKQLALVRSVNDTHIFVQQALPLLRKAKKQYDASADPEDKPYAVPSHKKSAVAKRNYEELREIYDRYIDSDLYNNLLVAIVSQCESFLFDVLRLVLRAYPQKITMNIQGVEQKRAVDIEMILNASDIDEVRCNLVEQRLHSISYAKPADYLCFLNRVAQVTTDDDAFAAYIEIKATRDIIIHNGGIANAAYIEKAGPKARVAIKALLPMNAKYFDHTIAIIKRIAVIVKRDTEKHFGG